MHILFRLGRSFIFDLIENSATSPHDSGPSLIHIDYAQNHKNDQECTATTISDNNPAFLIIKFTPTSTTAIVTNDPLHRNKVPRCQRFAL